MMDEETQTLWSHVSGEALDGPLQGRKLENIPSVQTTWGEWRSAHPETKVLKKPEEILSSRYEKYFKDPDRAGIFRTFWLEDRLAAKAIVHGITLGPDAVAVVDAALTSGVARQINIGETVVTVTQSADGGVRAQTADGQELLVRTAFWFAWSGFYPHTEVVE